jgi:amino acid transporter
MTMRGTAESNAIVPKMVRELRRDAFMFNDRGNLIGVLLLGLCAVAAGVMIWAIVTGQSLEYNGPGWLTTLLAILFIGGSLYGMFMGGIRRRKSGGTPQWPSPGHGQRPWWRFWGKD